MLAPATAAVVEVSIHAPARGATCASAWLPRLNARFNPRARAGRDPHGRRCAPRRSRVSIHAPARGATGDVAGTHVLRIVSIHAPARGATSRRLASTGSRSRFNPRARAGRDRRMARRSRADFSVSIHAPARGATRGTLRLEQPSDLVSIHAPARGATRIQRYSIDSRRFQSTRPRGARRRLAEPSFTPTMFQSTRPRGARQLPCPTRSAIAGQVSIHAPARGATLDSRSGTTFVQLVSIHAPARGATGHAGARVTSASVFQSTRPRGARRTVHRPNRSGLPVSIHAPARGATSSGRRCRVMRPWFQSTRPRGARPMPSAAPASSKVFQSTRPRGARLHGNSRRQGRQERFNPRARAGRDLRYYACGEYGLIGFQSTRPRGARLATDRNSTQSTTQFQSTRPRGARLLAPRDI